jgi:multidrug efflux system membrane fusion protein
LRDTAQGVWLGGLPAVANVILVGQEYVTEGSAVLASYEEVLK